MERTSPSRPGVSGNRTPAPFGRRACEVTRNLPSDGYRIFSALDQTGPEPAAGQFYMLAGERGWGEGGGRPFLPRAVGWVSAWFVAAGTGLLLSSRAGSRGETSFKNQQRTFEISVAGLELAVGRTEIARERAERAIEVVLVDSYDPTGPFGAKGVGEPTCVSTAAAILNAIHDAVGVRVTSLPATAEKVYAAIKAKRAQEGRVLTAG